METIGNTGDSTAVIWDLSFPLSRDCLIYHLKQLSSLLGKREEEVVREFCVGVCVRCIFLKMFITVWKLPWSSVTGDEIIPSFPVANLLGIVFFFFLKFHLIDSYSYKNILFLYLSFSASHLHHHPLPLSLLSRSRTHIQQKRSHGICGIKDEWNIQSYNAIIPCQSFGWGPYSPGFKRLVMQSLDLIINLYWSYVLDCCCRKTMNIVLLI